MRIEQTAGYRLRLPGAVLLLTFWFSADAPLSPQAEPVEATGSLSRLEVQRQENLFQEELRLFRTYPHLERAYRLIDGGRLEEAREELEKYLELDAQDLSVRFTYLILLDQMKDAEEVVRQADIILQQRPGFGPALVYRGLAHQALGQLKEAMEDFGAAAADSEMEDLDFALDMLADVALQGARYSESLVALDRLAEIQAVDFRLCFRQGVAREGLGQLEEAEAAYRVALSLAEEPEQRLQVYRALGEVAKKRRDWEVARRAFLNALELDSENPEVLRALGDVAYAQGDYPDTVQWLRRSLEVRPDAADREFLANVLCAMDDYEAAVQELALLLSEVDAPEDRHRVYTALGNAYTRLERYPEASQALQEAAQIRPDYATVHALAHALEREGRLEEAVPWFEKRLQLEPSAGAHLELGMIYAKVGENDSAIEQLEQALQAGLPQDRQLVAYKQLGFLCQQSGRYRQARQALEKALELDPQDVTLYSALGDTLVQLGAVERAIDLFEKLLASQPSAQLHFKLGMLYLKIDRTDPALEHLEQAAQGELPEAQKVIAYKQRGFVYYRLRQYKQARHAFEKALELRGQEASLYPILGEVCIQQGDLDSAMDYLKRALALQETPSAVRALAQAQIEAGSVEAAITTYQEHLRKLPDRRQAAPDILETLAFLEAQRGNYPEAAALYLEAFERGGETHHPLLRQAAYCLVTAEQWEQARQLYLRMLRSESLPESLRGETWENLGYLERRLKHYPQAAEAFQKAVERGRDTWRLRQDLAFTLYTMEEWEKALQQFRLALEKKKTAQGLACIGRCYKALNKPGVAIHFYRLALEGPETLEASEQRDLYNDLGYLYAREAEYADSAWAWEHSLALEDDSVVRLHLGRMQRLQGQLEQSRETLEGISPESLPLVLQAERLDELAEMDRSEGRLESTRERLLEANTIEPTADRYYRLGLVCRELHRLKEAVDFGEEALRREPENIEYAVALGYAYADAGQPERTMLLFEDAIERDPDLLSLYEDLAYIYMRQPDNEQAVYWFKHAIDSATPSLTGSPEEEKELQRRIYRMRQEITKLNNRWDVTAYLSYRSDAEQQVTTPVGVSGGGISSQGGLEVAYQPPKIGFRDGRVFQVFGRVLWNVEPDSLRFDEDSYQGGVGARYKPFKRHNLFFSGEKLFRIGDDADDNWLLRALYSWDDGLTLKPGEKDWNYTLLYADAAYFVDSPDYWAYYGEVRQGRTFNFDDCFLVTPHLVVDGRYQDRGAATGSYIEGGAGVSFRYLFNDSYYEVHRSSFELLVQYKAGRFYHHASEIEDDSFDGVVITGIVRF